MIWVTIWTVLMILWLFGGGYYSYDASKPHLLIGGTLIPWICVLILGLVLFGGIHVGGIR